jgi:hypothetical protein
MLEGLQKIFAQFLKESQRREQKAGRIQRQQYYQFNEQDRSLTNVTPRTGQAVAGGRGAVDAFAIKPRFVQPRPPFVPDEPPEPKYNIRVAYRYNLAADLSGETVVMIGGDRKTPTEAHRIPAGRTYSQMSLDSTGAGLSQWVLSYRWSTGGNSPRGMGAVYGDGSLANWEIVGGDEQLAYVFCGFGFWSRIEQPYDTLHTPFGGLAYSGSEDLNGGIEVLGDFQGQSCYPPVSGFSTIVQAYCESYNLVGLQTAVNRSDSRRLFGFTQPLVGHTFTGTNTDLRVETNTRSWTRAWTGPGYLGPGAQTCTSGSSPITGTETGPILTTTDTTELEISLNTQAPAFSVYAGVIQKSDGYCTRSSALNSSRTSFGSTFERNWVGECVEFTTGFLWRILGGSNSTSGNTGPLITNETLETRTYGSTVYLNPTYPVNNTASATENLVGPYTVEINRRSPGRWNPTSDSILAQRRLFSGIAPSGGTGFLTGVGSYYTAPSSRVLITGGREIPFSAGFNTATGENSAEKIEGNTWRAWAALYKRDQFGAISPPLEEQHLTDWVATVAEHTRDIAIEVFTVAGPDPIEVKGLALKKPEGSSGILSRSELNYLGHFRAN